MDVRLLKAHLKTCAEKESHQDASWYVDVTMLALHVNCYLH